MAKEWRWQRREKKKESEKQRMPKSGKDLGETYKNANKNREKDMEKSLLLGKINKMILKQNAMEDAAGMNLPSTTPQQAQNMGAKPPQPQQGQAPQSNPQMNFDATGGVAMSPEIQKKLDRFTALDERTQIKMINTMNSHDPDNYQIIKFSATRGSPEVQGVAAWKLNLDDLETLIQPTTDNAKAVSALALKTGREENWKALAEHSDPLVRRALVRNRNVEDVFLKDMYDDMDLQVRVNIIDRTFNQDLLHLFIADKSFYVLKRLMPKLDADGLKILERHPNTQIKEMARSRKSNVDMQKLKKGPEADKNRNSFNDFESDGDEHTGLPDVSVMTPAGFGMNSQNSPAMIRNSLVVKISSFLTKAELEKDRYSKRSIPPYKVEDFKGEPETVASDSSPISDKFKIEPKKKEKEMPFAKSFKSEDGVEGILSIVKSVGEEFFGGK